MMDSLQEASVAQLKKLLSDYNKDSFQISDVDVQQYTTRSIAAVYRITGNSSVYSMSITGILKSSSLTTKNRLRLLIGVVKALAADLEDNSILSHVTLARGEVFSDFLEMAEHLVDSGYKDPAAVIAGSALEAHLKQLCQNRDIAIERERNSRIQPVNANTLNADLVKSSAYSKIDEKNVTAWLGLRNDAAHGRHDEYGNSQVVLMISSIRDFIARNPE